MQDVIVLKCGGSTIDQLSEDFFTNIQLLQETGLKPVIVHGGGPEIKEMLTKLNISFEFVNGLRKTTEDIMNVVEMVLCGNVNKRLTRSLNAAGMQAIGLSGSDANLFSAKPIDFAQFGYVGEIEQVNDLYLKNLLDQDIVPVLAPIALGQDGKRYNVNADTAAGAVAKALNAKQLIFVTDVPGVMKNGKLLATVTEETIRDMIADDTIYGGMVPKVTAALDSLTGAVNEVMIVDGKQSALQSDRRLVGTVIKKTAEVVQ
ncbi:acetylglutamate kinase [Virgibacillus sp. W0430]|uniref:acetylglutamate kinase n=1 Tax=Virgibacillus sp. W0430 TaxID=3391580 RepID=UPI003F4693E4